MRSINLIIITSILTSCTLFDEGENEILKEVSNEQKNKKSIVFLKSGNATADNSLQISIVNYESELGRTEVGNTYTADSDYGKLVLDETAILLKWQSNDTLVISLDPRLRSFKKETLVDEVYVVYRDLIFN